MSTQFEPLETLPLSTLKGVGPQLEKRLSRLRLYRVADLLFHLPTRYQDRTQRTPLGAVQIGTDAVIEAEIVLTEVSRRGRSMLLCRLQDASGSLTLRFFHFSAAQQAKLAAGTSLRCFGEVRGSAESPEMIHPEYQILSSTEPLVAEPYLTPIYPSTDGLAQTTLRRLIEQALGQMNSDTLAEHMPESLRQSLALMTLAEAIELMHRPAPSMAAALAEAKHPAQRRLVFEELLAHQLSLRQLRQQARRDPAPVLRDAGVLRQRFLDRLTFTLTQAQQKVCAEIDADLAQASPMLRLVQGDVGSGKTVVAALAALRAVENGQQVAIMAPTELLSEQHQRVFRAWLEPLDITVEWLTGKIKGKARTAALEQIRQGEAKVVIGTHALFQEVVVFHDLALVIIDEQHRFGVHQRLALREKGRQGARCPHQLIMTATPIPRTLAMSAYADLDTSTIDELPPGRTPVTTVAISENRRDQVIDRIRLACASGRQAYWVCPLIEESDVLQCQAAADTAITLEQALPKLRVGLIHGRLAASEKETIMALFQSGQLDLLVATTVIEVGVDVVNASLMIIENAERLGLAQLHQLRGRVGRGSAESHCVLLYRPPLSPQAHQRLAILRASNDGFVIARRDLELRGPGEVLGVRQSGDLQFRIAHLLRDEDLLPSIRQAADALLRHYPTAAEAIIQRWIGQGQAYGAV